MKTLHARIIKGKPLRPIRFRASEKGQSLAELSVMLVIMLILFAGLLDFGRMSFLYMSMRDAAQEGAAYGAVYSTYCDHIQDRIKDTLPPTSRGYDVTVQVNGMNCQAAAATVCAGQEISVEVTTDFDITMPFLSAFTGEQIHLNAQVTDTVIRPSCGP